ncbi:YfcE family phosphodiesterase [Patescibacteria group bacterium]
MKVAIISDIHDNTHNLICALDEAKVREVEQVLCLGDLVMGTVAKILANFNVPVFSVWGNNIGDKAVVMKISLEDGSNLKLSERTYDSVEVDGKRLFLSHYPELAEPIAKSGEFDAVFFGHTHFKEEKMIGDCLVANPGEIAGNISREATFIIYDTEDNSIEFVNIADAIIIRTDRVDEFMESIHNK